MFIKNLTSESETMVFRFLFGTGVVAAGGPSLSDDSEAKGFLESKAFFF